MEYQHVTSLKIDRVSPLRFSEIRILEGAECPPVIAEPAGFLQGAADFGGDPVPLGMGRRHDQGGFFVRHGLDVVGCKLPVTVLDGNLAYPAQGIETLETFSRLPFGERLDGGFVRA